MEKAHFQLDLIHRAFFNSSPEAVLLTDAEGKLLDQNQAWTDLFAPEPESGNELAHLGRIRPLLSQPDQVRDWFREIQTESFLPKENHFQLNDGSQLKITSFPLRAGEQFLGRNWTARILNPEDVDARLREKSHAISQAVIQKSQDGILIVSDSQKVIGFNQVYLDLFKLTEDFLRNESPQKVIEYSVSQLTDTERFRGEIYDLIRNPDLEKYSLIEFLNGKIVERFTETLRAGDKVLGRVLFYRDITEATNRINELITSQFEMDKFIYSASHDLKAPMDSMRGLLNILEMEDVQGAPRKYLTLLSKSLEKMQHYVRNLAEFSQNQNLEVGHKQIHFHELLEEVIGEIRSLERFKNVRLELPQPTFSTLFSDPVRLRIILKNLLSNAVKYHDYSKEDRWIKVELDKKPKAFEIRILDNGIGMTAEDQARIYDLFFRATHQAFGSGLGLYVTSKTIEKLRGSIQCQSTPGIGTTFSILIPQSSQQATA